MEKGKKELQHKELQIDNLLHKVEKEKVARAEEKREIKELRNDVSSLQKVRHVENTCNLCMGMRACIPC